MCLSLSTQTIDNDLSFTIILDITISGIKRGGTEEEEEAEGG